MKVRPVIKVQHVLMFAKINNHLQDFNMVKIESRPRTKQTLTKRWGNTTENMKAIYREYAGWRRV